MATFTTDCSTATSEELDFVDITDDIEKALIDSEIVEGRVIIFSNQRDCTLLLNERETGLLSDIRNTIERLAPGNNGARSSLLGSASLTVPVVESRLGLGTWQRVLLVDLAGPAERTVSVQIVGESG